ncbi:MAG: hypothetical protein AAGA60_13500 [Cyanobacteria bacterium P01_E01_bin.42]
MLQDNNAWEQICEQWQERIWDATPKLEFRSPKRLYTQILKDLIAAENARKLKTKQHEIRALLKFKKAEPKHIEQYGSGTMAILGGSKNLKRRKDIVQYPYFERVDGCWFDFSILLNSDRKPVEILGFDFEIRFPEKYGVTFLRFDLNPPKHRNEERGMRFHIHPGHEDLMIPSSPLSPLEILSLFLYGITPQSRSRTRALSI